MYRFELIHNIWFFQCKAYSSFFVIKANTQNLCTSTNLIIHVENIVQTIILYIHWIVVLIRFQFLKSFCQGIQSGQRFNIKAVLVNQLFIPDCIVCDREGTSLSDIPWNLSYCAYCLTSAPTDCNTCTDNDKCNVVEYGVS